VKRAILAIGLLCAFAAFAQEHPEHPANKQAKKTDHVYSMDELEKAIVADINAKTTKDGGAYKMEDKEANKTWSLKLDHVHKERLARLDAKTYFACTDFKSDDKHTVDVDFFMKDDGEKLVMTDASIHKIDGQPRYNWKEKDGYWVKVPVEK
jgi:hypothetical protein